MVRRNGRGIVLVLMHIVREERMILEEEEEEERKRRRRIDVLISSVYISQGSGVSGK